ncbi:MAG: putative sugar nucleotidyl transferase [Candidatus Hinthialibacter antarcticus]|nr:putative sugar nucleotidyl transferase [Candidatus Hinthialibacter antarcticus]
MNNIILFEDEGWKQLRPLTWTRPAYLLRCGVNLLSEKAAQAFHTKNVSYHARPALQNWLAAEGKPTCINGAPSHAALLLNGRAVWCLSLAEQITQGDDDCCFVQDGVLVAVRCSAQRVSKIDWEQLISITDFSDLPQRKISATVIQYHWDLVYENPAEIVSDIAASGKSGAREGTIHPGVTIVGDHALTCRQDSEIDPCTFIDTRKGPVWLGEGAKVMSHSMLQGPCVIGTHSIVKSGGKIYSGTTCGEWCKLGGEVEQSILLSYSNKQHEGFLGHSYVGAWVNIAASSNTSDLRNDYANIMCIIDGERVSTGRQFVGAAFGDHTKTGIQAMINTGAVIGAFCNLFGLGYSPREIPSFAWGGPVGWSEHRFDKALEAASRMMERRSQSLTPELEKLYQSVYEQTRDERERIFHQQAED